MAQQPDAVNNEQEQRSPYFVAAKSAESKYTGTKFDPSGSSSMIPSTDVEIQGPESAGLVKNQK